MPKRQLHLAIIAFVLLTAIGAAAQTNSTWENFKAGTTNAWQKTKEGSSNAWETVKQGSTQVWENVKEGSSNAWSSAKEKFDSNNTNYLFAKKDAFVAKANAELSDLDQKIKQLSDKTAKATAPAKAEAEQKLQSVKTERANLGKKLDDARAATKTDWNKAQAEFQKAYDDTKNSVKAAWDWVKSKTQ